MHQFYAIRAMYALTYVQYIVIEGGGSVGQCSLIRFYMTKVAYKHKQRNKNARNKNLEKTKNTLLMSSTLLLYTIRIVEKKYMLFPFLYIRKKYCMSNNERQQQVLIF